MSSEVKGLSWVKANHSIDNVKLDAIWSDIYVDRCLIMFGHDMKMLVKEYEDYGVRALTSCLGAVIDDYRTFLEEWRNEDKKK